MIDATGTEAELFGAKTSGHATLYGTGGQLLFEGGITGSRGHQGDNAGVSSIAKLLAGEKPDVKGTDVFGCGLFDSPMFSAVGRTLAGLLPMAHQKHGQR